ncbi:MAG: hypothetical protein AAF431_06360 [Pseudomonadota bacterium]
MNKYAIGMKVSLLLALGASLTACGGSRTVVTQDDSADYHSAVSLPPLKKPSKQAAAAVDPTPPSVEPTPAPPPAAAPVASTPVEPIQDAEPPIEEIPIEEIPIEESPIPETSPQSDQAPVSERLVIEEQPAPAEQPIQAEPVQAESVQAESLQTEPVQVAAVEPQPSMPVEEVISARVIQPRDDVARLQIDSGFDAAWNYLSTNLKNSDITVHNRNRTAGRFAIGCGNLEESTTVTKRGGWSIFTRKPKKQEHCSMQLLTSRSVTLVTLNNRSGVEIAADSAKEVFMRLLNN